MFGSLLKATLRTALLPVDVVMDAVTLGGSLVDKDEPITVTAVKDICKDVTNAIDSIGV